MGKKSATGYTAHGFSGLFSLVCLIAHHLSAANPLRPASTAWYLKTEATFSDVLAQVRRAVWADT